MEHSQRNTGLIYLQKNVQKIVPSLIIPNNEFLARLYDLPDLPEDEKLKWEGLVVNGGVKLVSLKSE